MSRGFWMFVLGCACSLSVLAVPSFAAVGNATTPVQPALIEVLQGVPANVTVNQVAAMPATAFTPLNAGEIYPTDPQKSIWLRIKVPGQSPDAQAGWVFALAKPFVDRVEFYYRNQQGGWQVEQAGDQVPQQLWAFRGLHPQFALPTLRPGVNDIYVKVNHSFPLRLNVALKSPRQAAFDSQNAMLSNGLVLGFLMFAALLGMVLAVIYRTSVYALYAAYLLLAFCSAAAYAGIAHYAFWPSASRWSEQAGVVCLMAATTAQLQFCRAMFGAASLALWGRRVVLLGTVVSAVSTALYLWLPLAEIQARTTLMWLCLGTTTSLCLWTVGRAALARNMVARLWGVAYVPTIAVLTLTLIDEMGVASVSWLPHNAILFALGFEAVVFLIALHLHVKDGHAKTVRHYTLADVDPLTGFVAPRQFPKALADAWAAARQERRDLSVVYVQANFKAGPLRKTGSNDVEAAALRCVRIMRTVTREADTVARVHANLFAVLMPGVSPGDSLSGKLSRLIALGVMTDRDDPLSEPVNLRIAASSRSRFSGTAQQLDELLRQKLLVDVNDEARSIVYVTG